MNWTKLLKALSASITVLFFAVGLAGFIAFLVYEYGHLTALVFILVGALVPLTAALYNLED